MLVIRTFPLLLCAIAVLLGSACRGDPGYSMFIENVTGEPVVVYEFGAYPTGDRGFTLQPGETKVTHWFRPRDENDKQDTMVKAISGTGVVIFCRMYSYDRAKDNFHWTIRIAGGVSECV
ncbi:MAG: hypothetical protein M3P38_05045 [Chloroflexota bacterium]|nr:hypothetical protein [Chloroflexota bacterium]